jgi:hypothetical protein
MSQLQVIDKEDTLQKISSTGLIVGAILLLVFNILSPRPDDPTSMQSVLTAMADERGITLLSQLFLAFSIWMVMIGSAGVYRSIIDDGAAWARLGFYGIIVGTVLWGVTFGLGSAMVHTAVDWAAAPAADKPAAYTIAAAVSNATSGIETMSIIMLWLALAFLGFGMARSADYPRWLGWTVVVLGIAMVAAVGIPKFFNGNTSTLLILFGGIAVLTTVLLLVVGFWVARKAW